MKINKMKNKIALTSGLLMMTSLLFGQINETEGVSIANEGAAPKRDAVLDVVSSTKGMLVPRVSYSVIEEGSGGPLDPANVSAVEGQDGLLVFVDDFGSNYGYWFFNYEVNKWQQLVSNSETLGLWEYSPTQEFNPETGLSSQHIYNKGLMNGKVGVGINQAAYQLHVFGKTREQSSVLPGAINPFGTFVAETDNHSFGIYDYYTEVGPGHLMIHRKKVTQSNISWQQRNSRNNLDLAIFTVYSDADNSDYSMVNFQGNMDDGTPSPGVINSNGKIILNSELGGWLTIDENGVEASNPGGVVSDTILKTNFETIDNPIDQIMLIQGYKYNYKTDPVGATKSFGVVAQNIQRVFPELAMDIDIPNFKSDTVFTEETHLGVNYIGLIPVLIEGTKEQQRIIDSLETRINELEAVFEDLNTRITNLEE